MRICFKVHRFSDNVVKAPVIEGYTELCADSQLLDLSTFGTIERYLPGLQSSQVTSVSVDSGNYRTSALLMLRLAGKVRAAGEPEHGDCFP